MKTLLDHKLLSLFIVLLSLTGCKEDIVNPPADILALTSLKGRVINWTLGDSVIALAGRQQNIYGRGESLFIFGTSHVNNDGSFSLALSNPPPDLLMGYANGNYRFSDTAKFCNMLGLILRYPNASFDSKLLHNASEPFSVFISDTAKIGDYYCYFEYADRDVNMVGTDTYWHDNPPNADTIFTRHDLHYKKGWNRIVSTIISKETHSRIELRTVKNVSEGHWYYEY